MRNVTTVPRALGPALLLACLSSGLHALDVEIRMVPHDRVEQTVDALEQTVVQRVRGINDRGDVDAKAVVCWAKNVTLNGETLFEKRIDGKLYDRRPRARKDLKPGQYVFQPGGASFTVEKDGSIKSNSTELIVRDRLILLKAYPLRIDARWGNPGDPDAPDWDRIVTLPRLTIADASLVDPLEAPVPPQKDPAARAKAESERKRNADMKVAGFEVLPEHGTFSELTLWLPAHTSGAGYAVYPLGYRFKLTPAGLADLTLGGKPAEGLDAQAFALRLTAWSIRVSLDDDCKAAIDGVNSFQERPGESEQIGFLYPHIRPFTLHVNPEGPNADLGFDVKEWPHKVVQVDRSTPGRAKQRGLLAEWQILLAQPETKLLTRLRMLLPKDAPEDGEGPKPIAELRPMHGDDWQTVPVESREGGVYALALPDGPNGIYVLRVGFAPGKDAAPLMTEQHVAMARELPYSAGVFTQRGRTGFRRGEAFWLALGIKVNGPALPAATPVEVALVDSGARRLVLHASTLAKQIEKQETILLNVTSTQSLALAPGVYRIEAKVGGLETVPQTIRMVSGEPASHFAAHVNGKYCDLGSVYAQLIQQTNPVQEAEALADDLVSAGSNVFTAFTYDMSQRHRRKSNLIEELARQVPSLGPWESFYQPSGRDTFLDAATKRGLRVYHNTIAYVDDLLPRGQKARDGCVRFAALETASMRHSPAFEGLCLYDELYDIANPGTPSTEYMLKLEELEFREKHEGMASDESMRALERWYRGLPGRRNAKDLEKYKLWPQFQDDEWRMLSEQMARAAKTVMPRALNFTQHRMFGGNGDNIGMLGGAPKIFEPLDIAVNVGYKDGGAGDRPVWGPMGADVMRIRGDIPVWSQIADYHIPGDLGACKLRNTFLTLSQQVEGITFFNQGFARGGRGSAQNQGDSREGHRDIAKHLLEPYGDFFLKLKRGYKKVAVYYSREAHYLGPKKSTKLAATCEGLWVACLRAGFPADYLYDHQILADEGMAYEVIFVPGYTLEDEVPESILKSLRRLQSAGKVLAVEQTSKLPLEGLVRLASDLDEYDDKMGGAFPKFIDFETEMVVDQSEATTKLVKEFLAKHIPPAAEHEMLFGPDWLRGGAGEYLILANFRFTGFSGLHKTFYQAPAIEKLRIPKRSPVCFDVLENKRIEVPADGDWMTLQADMREYPGKIFAFLPAEPVQLRLEASAQVDGGSTLTYRLTVLDAQGNPIDAAFPFEIVISDGAGHELERLYRAGIGEYLGAFGAPVNAGGGKLAIRVRELIGGLQAQSTVDVQDKRLPPSAVVSDEVLVTNAELAQRFLSDKSPVVIALPEDQTWTRQQAERLKAWFERSGREARIEPEGGLGSGPQTIPQATSDLVDPLRMWRGSLVYPIRMVDTPVVVLGNAYASPLVRSLVERGALAHPISTHFPGRGRAMIACVHRGFSNAHDTLALLANDAEGLERAVALLEKNAPLAETWPSRPTFAGATPDPKALGTKVASADREPSSLRERLGLIHFVRSLDEDPATGRVLVGTEGYATNLYCLSRGGEVLWKTFLPEHDVYYARWYDEGKRVVASTANPGLVFLLNGEDGRVFRKFSGTLWPRYHEEEGPVSTHLTILDNPKVRQLLIKGLAGLLAVSYEGERQWYIDRSDAIAAYPKEADQRGAAQFPSTLHLGNVVVSPDGEKIALGQSRNAGTTKMGVYIYTVWRFEPEIFNARTGERIAQLADERAENIESGHFSLAWNAGEEWPRIVTGGQWTPWPLDGKLGTLTPSPGLTLADGSAMEFSLYEVMRRAPNGQPMWTHRDARVWMPSLDRMDAKSGRVYRCDRDGAVMALDLESGKPAWEARMPFSARLLPLAEGLLAGAINGDVVKFDAAGKQVWRVRLRDLVEYPDRPYAQFVAQALRRDRDSTEEFFPLSVDRPGDYDALLRMGVEQLDQPGFERSGGWQAEGSAPAFVEPGLDGKRALRLLPGTPVTQKLPRKAIPSATYLLEFRYKLSSPQAALVAGGALSGEKETFTVSRFGGVTGEWLFGRLAVKTYAETKGLTIGLEAVGGEVLVDAVSLRAVRFPSSNLLADAELHAVEPTYVRDIRVQYNRIAPELSKRLASRNHMVVFAPGTTTGTQKFVEEQAFLHNGRLDDIGPIWTYPPRAMGFSAVLAKPAFISHIVLYLNNANPENAYRHLCILANDLEAQPPVPKTIALVKGNNRRFVVVRLPKPMLTDAIKILPGKHPGRHESLTEVELYGPLDGEDAPLAGATDPLAFPMLLANPRRVPDSFPEDVTGAYAEQNTNRIGATPAFQVGATYVDRVFTFGEAGGAIRSIADRRAESAAEEKKNKRKSDAFVHGPAWGLASITPTSTPARYARRLFVGSADGKLHAVADNGTYLWGFKTGGRVYSSPAPVGDDLYFGSDDGTLYKVDVHSGTVLWEFPTGGKIRGGPAVAGGLVVFASGKGELIAVRAEEGQAAWRAPIAPHTRATPAIFQDRIYIGDEKGVAHAFDLHTGRELWKRNLSGYHSIGPVVTPQGICFASEQGEAAWLDADGGVRWKAPLPGRLLGQPIATRTQLLFPTSAGPAVLRQADGNADDRFKPPEFNAPINAILAYDRTLFMQKVYVHEDQNFGAQVFLEYHGGPVIWAPASEPEPQP
ncbi:MAG: PQQ-binding-like beta-propeller repeat protein [Planctomycetes bacterium]|nr:PQQ-binding-like beta-propeller repeat protein [Planctomycetota bacterium]